MNAIQLLRQMHADTKVRFKVILGADDAAGAAAQWEALQPLLDLHEQLEDDFVYTPLIEELQAGPGTPLGDWFLRHEADVALVKQLIAAAGQLDPATPEWRMGIGTIMDLLNKHVTDEEGQIFGRIEQVWSQARLEEAGQAMQKVKDSAAPAGQSKSSVLVAKSTGQKPAAKRRPLEAAPQTRRPR
jgi:hypothetical protein